MQAFYCLRQLNYRRDLLGPSSTSSCSDTLTEEHRWKQNAFAVTYASGAIFRPAFTELREDIELCMHVVSQAYSARDLRLPIAIVALDFRKTVSQ